MLARPRRPLQAFVKPGGADFGVCCAVRRLALLLAFLGPASGAVAQPADCTVDAALERSASGLALDVHYRCRGASDGVTFHAESERIARHVADFSDPRGYPVAALDDRWRVTVRDGIAQARYRYDLSGYARVAASNSWAIQHGGGVLALLSSWLLEPREVASVPTIDITVRPETGLAFAAGLPRAGDAWGLAGVTLRFAGYSVLGAFDLRDIDLPAPGSLRPGATPARSRLRLAILGDREPQARDDLADWVRRTALAQTHYWVGFTYDGALMALVPGGSRPVGFGRVVPGGGVSGMIQIGARVDPRRLFDDWVLTHELIHTGMPFVRGRATWFMEGAATYIEPIVRARAGWKSEAEVWTEWLEQMPIGVSAFDAPLVQVQGRQAYWAGALFMLLADLGIRQASGGAHGLEDCLKGALHAGFTGDRRVSLAEYVDACDRATGTTAMSTLVRRHVADATPVNLAALWRDLGVAREDGRIVLDDMAPLARWRRLIVPGIGPPRHVPRPWEN